MKLKSNIEPNSEAFQKNAAHHRALAQQLRERTAEIAKGGPEQHRKRHTERGKLLPRERVERLLDPGAPFLEVGALAAYDLYNGEAPAAGIITGVGRVSGREVMIVANDATVKGGAILYSSESAVKVGLEAIQALGGAGYTRDFPVERFLRDAKLYDIGAGTSEVRRFLIGREVIGA